MLLTLKPSSTKLLLPMQPESHCSPGESGQEGNKGMFSHSKASGSRQPEPRAPLLTQSLSGVAGTTQPPRGQEAHCRCVDRQLSQSESPASRGCQSKRQSHLRSNPLSNICDGSLESNDPNHHFLFALKNKLPATGRTKKFKSRFQRCSWARESLATQIVLRPDPHTDNDGSCASAVRSQGRLLKERYPRRSSSPPLWSPVSCSIASRAN